ncbi:MAG: GTPase HflX [Thermoanaerobaculia bacterium]
MEKVLLVGVSISKKNEKDIWESMDELNLLSKTLNCEVVDKIIQKRDAPDPATFIGRGKAEEISKIVQEKGIKAIIFDCELSPSQVKNLEEIIHCKIIDRTWLILSIFAEKARTEEAKVQVSLAQYEYLLSRLTKRWTHLSRQWGGIGTKGVGEKQLELDRRAIKERINHFKKQLKKIEQRREITFKSHENFPRVALVGYTNAGKSTLFNLLTNSQVKVSDMLFSTLDPKVSKISKLKIPIIFSDTVGFIKNIPHHLIASFKSTLKEAMEADLVLHIVDRSHPNFEDQEKVGLETLDFLKISKENILTLYNKADLLFDSPQIPFPYISAKNGWGMDNLIQIIEEKIKSKFLIIKKDYESLSRKELEEIIKNSCVENVQKVDDKYEVKFWVRKSLP